MQMPRSSIQPECMSGSRNGYKSEVTGLGHAKVRDCSFVAVVVGQGTQCAALMSAEKREAIDVACVDPTESVKR